MQKIAVIAAATLLSGCAVTYDVLQLSPNRYQVSSMAAPARGGQAGAQTLAMAAAIHKCGPQGKAVKVIDTEDHWVFPANSSVILTFECD